MSLDVLKLGKVTTDYTHTITLYVIFKIHEIENIQNVIKDNKMTKYTNSCYTIT
jgi:hypothetical protein